MKTAVYAIASVSVLTLVVIGLRKKAVMEPNGCYGSVLTHTSKEVYESGAPFISGGGPITAPIDPAVVIASAGESVNVKDDFTSVRENVVRFYGKAVSSLGLPHGREQRLTGLMADRIQAGVDARIASSAQGASTAGDMS